MPVSESTITRPTDRIGVPDTRGVTEDHEFDDEPHIVRGLD